MSMDVNSIQSLYATNDISALASPLSQQQSTAIGDVASAVSVNLSQPGQLWSQLQSLAKTDPSQFKEVTAEIASKLKDAASSMTGKQADFVNGLADKFQAASKSGSMSDLHPAGQGQAQAHHGPHHHHVQAASSSTQLSDSTQSGTDSVLEQVQSIIANALNSVSSPSASSS